MLVKVNPDYEILFRLMDELSPDAGCCYWISEDVATAEIGDKGEELGPMATEIELARRVQGTMWDVGQGRRWVPTQRWELWM